MSLRLKASGEHSPLPLRGGAVWHLRPATSIDEEVAAVRAGRMLAGLVAGSEAAAALREVFGDALDLGEIDAEGLVAVTGLLTDVHLATICSAGWEGIEDADGMPVPEPSQEWVAMILTDGTVRRRVRARLYAALHEEVEEKKGSPLSPDGAAPAAVEPAPPAGPGTSPAQ